MRLKTLVIMMALLPVMAVPTSTAVLASDLSLYRGNTTGKTSILLMLDTSGSMGISSLVLPKNNTYGSPGDVDSSLCSQVDVKEFKNDYKDSTAVNFKEWAYNLRDTATNRTSIQKSVTIGTTTITYYVRGCTSNGVTQYDRLSRLKDAILPLLAESPTTGLSDSVVMGLGQFSSRTELTIGNVPTKLVDGHSGRIVVPNAPLTTAQRIKIAQALAAIKSIDTSTNEDGTSNTNLKISSQTYPDVIKAASGTPTAHAYAEAAAYMMGTNTGGSATSSSKVGYIYDGYMLKQKGSEQVYLLCATSGGGTTSALGATVKQCPSDWPEWNNSDKTVQGTTIYKPYDGSCTKANSPNQNWCTVSFSSFKTEVGGGMSSLWDAYKKLPVGWRFDGWVKVPTEPLDIEPVVGTVWGYPDSINGLVSYRTNPFSLDGTNDNTVGGFAYSVAESKNGNNYIAGGSTNSCDGNGIYFLTDGAPNSTKDDMARTILNRSLTDTYKFSAKPTGTGVLVSPTLKSDLFAGETGGWEYIGEYAKKVRNRTEESDTQKNPADMNIKTAVVGFGASFAGLTKNTDGTYNCASAPNDDAKNACLWGSKAYGDGGFYYAENSADIKNSIRKFVNDVSVGFTPSSLGAISVPRDPLDQTKSMTEGFFPMIMPMEDSTFRTWTGNLKKYKILGGTLKDSSNNAIYKIENNQQIINSSAKDLWSNAAAGSDHSLINSGGAWNKIPVPSTALAAADSISNVDSERKVYILDGSSLKKVTKTNLATDTTGTDALSGTYTINQRLALLNYMGYKTVFPAATTQTTLTSTEINTLAVNPASPYRFLGGVVHSTPLMLTKEATVSGANAAGTRDEYTVYGSMDGGLHIVDASTGKEQSVFVPPEIISNQYDTLAGKDSKGVGSLSGIAYGVDAPWVADNTFKVQITKSGTTATTKYVANKMNIFGGLRMGGSGLYGLDILNPASPKLLFQIKPTTTNEFQRMAQIWAKPTIAEIRVKGERKKVLIFGGGYDAAAYEQANAANPSSTYGNALYVVEAATGNLIWMSSSDTSGVSTANSHKQTVNSDMNYSVVGQPVVRDYDADGLADMIYFADLGGQVFRVDLNNNNQMSATTNTNIAVRVKTLAKLKDGTFVPRFYDRLSTAVFDDGQNRFVLVTAGSGNRSFPLEAEVGGKNKIYGLIDRDAAANGLEKSSFTSAATILPANLANSGILGKTVTKQISAADIAKMKLTTGNTMLRGWSFELRSVDSGNYARAFEESQLITGDLYVSLYDPKATLTGTVSGCGGGVTGISTTHRICMPYGDCAAYVKTSYQGINGPAFGAVSSTDPRTTMLVGPVAETQEACVGNCPTANTVLTNKNLYTYSQARKIKPVRWFEW